MGSVAKGVERRRWIWVSQRCLQGCRIEYPCLRLILHFARVARVGAEFPRSARVKVDAEGGIRGVDSHIGGVDSEIMSEVVRDDDRGASTRRIDIERICARYEHLRHLPPRKFRRLAGADQYFGEKIEMVDDSRASRRVQAPALLLRDDVGVEILVGPVDRARDEGACRYVCTVLSGRDRIVDAARIDVSRVGQRGIQVASAERCQVAYGIVVSTGWERITAIELHRDHATRPVPLVAQRLRKQIVLQSVAGAGS